MPSKRRTLPLQEFLERRRLLAHYYVTPTGNDNGAGSAASPWQTLQFTSSHLVAGDTVSVAAGNYTGFIMGWDFPQNGTPESPIVWNADPGVTIVDSNNKTPDGINLEGASYIVLNGFTVTPAATEDPWRAGIRATSDSGVVIENNTVNTRAVDKYGIFSSFTTDLTVQKNTVSGAYNSLIYTSNSAVRPIVRGNVVHDGQGNGLHFNGDISQGGTGIVSGATIEQNTVYNVGSAGGSGINMDGVQNSVIRNNLVFNCLAKGIALYQIDAADGSKNNLVENNTIVMPVNSQYALTIKDGSTGNSIRNNILYDADSVSGSINISTDSLSGLVSNFNVVVGRFSEDDGVSSMSLAQWQSSSAQDLNSFISTPSALFGISAANDYHLAAASPAIDAGTASSAPQYDHDFGLRPAGNGYDIGSYEYNSVLTPPTIPIAPSSASGLAQGSTAALLQWTDNSTNESGFKIERSARGGPFVQIMVTSSNATSFLDAVLAPNTTYAYRVRATNEAGDSTYTTTVSVTTPAGQLLAPIDVSADPTSTTSIELTWSHPTPEGVASYRIYRSRTSNFAPSPATQIGTSATGDFVDSTLTKAVKYYYRVTAVGFDSIESPASTQVAAITVPSAPTVLIASVADTEDIYLGWSVPDMTSVSYYQIYRGSSANTLKPYDVATSLSYGDFVHSGAIYFYRVTAVTAAGVESSPSPIVSATVQANPPKNLAAVSTTVVSLTWTYSDPANADHFNIYRSTTSGFTPGPSTLMDSTTAYTWQESPIVGVTYYYKVTAVTLGGFESAPTSQVSGNVTSDFATLVAGGALVVTGTSAASDQMMIQLASDVVMVARGSDYAYFSSPSVHSVTISGLAGNDELNFDSSIATPVTFNGGSGYDTLYLNSGTFSFNSDARAGSDNLAVYVAGGASVSFNVSQHLSALYISDGGTASFAPGIWGYLYLQTLGLNPAATLNLGDSDLLLDYSGASPLSRISGYVLRGLSDGTDGITVLQGAGGNNVLATVDNTQSHFSSWKGQTIDATTVIGKYTYFGDVNLDGVVNAADSAIVSQNFGMTSGATWWQGDMTFDGAVLGDDFSTVSSNFGWQLPPQAASGNGVPAVQPTPDATGPAPVQSIITPTAPIAPILPPTTPIVRPSKARKKTPTRPSIPFHAAVRHDGVALRR